MGRFFALSALCALAAIAVYAAIGKRTISHLRQSGRKAIRAYHDVFGKLSYVMAGDVREQLVGLYPEGPGTRIDEAYVVYNEFASMLTAMDNATNNAEEMASNLTLDLNRGRQTGITMELLDIVVGPDAL